MFFRTLIASCLLSTAASVISAATPDENVVITTGTEEFDFIQGKNGPMVKHSLTLEYEATRRAEKIRPHIFHNNITTLDKASGGKPQYRNANSPTVFHDDSKVCYFNISLPAKGKKAKVQFKRTFTDAAHFTGMYPAEEYPVRSKKIIFRIPASMPGIELTDRNFPPAGIERSESTAPDGSRTLTYTVAALPAIPDDPAMPPALSGLAHIMVSGYFPDCDSLHRYHRRLLDVDTIIPGVGALVGRLTAGAHGRQAVIDSLYRHVQHTIRYVAFEEGEAAYRPDTPAEVMRKRYGDCKGMSLLLATLLNRAGIEAYIACTGTSDTPFRIAEIPSLAATDHMICIVPGRDTMLFLDPTHSHISSTHIPAWIRGKDAMMFTPEGYTLIDIPEASPIPSADSATWHYTLSSSGLTGTATRTCTEDMAEIFMTQLSDVPVHHRNELLAKTLIPMQHAMVVPDSIMLDTSTPGRITVTAPIANPSAVTGTDEAIYIDLNTSGAPLTSRIDPDRHSDYQFPLSGSVVRTATVALPPGSRVTIPESYTDSSPQATFSCTYSQGADTVTMVKTLTLHSNRLPLADIPAWNKALSLWHQAASRQIEISK